MWTPLNSRLRSTTQQNHTSSVTWQGASGKWQQKTPFTHHVSRFLNPGVPIALYFAALLLFFSVVQPVLAQDPISPVEAMLAANRAYEKGEYLEAAAGYEAIIRYGIDNSDLYYNLGNAYFKHGDLGRAILNYRRAYRLAPRDPDILTNLTIARAQTVDRLDVDNEGTLANLVQMAEEWLTLREAAFLALALWLILCGLAVIAILQPRRRRWWATGIVVIGFFLLVGLASMFNRYYTERVYPPAVIVAQKVDVTSGPGGTDQYLVEFDLHSGAEVQLLESRPGWRRISLSGNLQGWVPEETVELVIHQD
jgi:tetratricopeptide (TPR) repeat protein